MKGDYAMNKVYGYCRVSTKTQDINRQIRNIKDQCQDAVIVQEAFTGTTIDRPEWSKLYKKVKPGDTIYFDSVSRMSRNAEDGINLYFELYDKGVNLIFLNERHIDTDSYKAALRKIGIEPGQEDGTAEGKLVNKILEAVKEFMIAKASDDIIKAFEQSEKEVADLRKRTKQGIETARLNGKQIGAIQGVKLVTKKSIEAKEIIRKHSKSFGGSLNDDDTRKLAGIGRNTYYRYKKQISEEIA